MRPQKVSEEALRFAIEHAQENRGTVTALTARMSKTLGSPVNRRAVESWLHPDPKRRVEPKLGIGLVLLCQARELVEGGSEPMFPWDLHGTVRKARKAKA